MNNVKEDRKKRNVTFHGIPEVQDKEEVTPRDGLVPKHKTQNPLDNFGDAQHAYERKRSSTMIKKDGATREGSENGQSLISLDIQE